MERKLIIFKFGQHNINTFIIIKTYDTRLFYQFKTQKKRFIKQNDVSLLLTVNISHQAID